MFCLGRGEKGSFVRTIPQGEGLCDVEYIPLNTLNPRKKAYIRDVPEDGVKFRPADEVSGDDLVLVIPLKAPLLEELGKDFDKILEGVHKLKREMEIAKAASETKARIADRGTKERFKDLLDDIKKLREVPPRKIGMVERKSKYGEW